MERNLLMREIGDLMPFRYEFEVALNAFGEKGGDRITNKKDPKPSDITNIEWKGVKTVPIHRLAKQAWETMVTAARADGISYPLLMLTSGYRSYAQQKGLWEAALRKYHGDAVEANIWTARPGGSAHQSGRAFDFYLGIENSSKNAKGGRFNDLPAYLWLKANALNFGFYPYKKEPWHWEYNPPANFSGSVSTTSTVPSTTTSSSSSSQIDWSSKIVDAVAYNNRNYPKWQPYEMTIYPLLGFYNSSPTAEALADALIRWQGRNGLIADGKLGTDTLAKLRASRTPSTASSPTATVPSLPLSTSTISDSEAQKVLAFLGYNVSNYGLTAAIRRFQEDSSISPVSGRLESSTISRLSRLNAKLQYLKSVNITIPSRMNRFRFTHYYLVHMNDYPLTSEQVPVMDENNTILAYVNPDFYLDMCIEGSGFLSDGRMLNVAGKDLRADVSNVAAYTNFVLPKAKKRYSKNLRYTGLRLGSDGSVVKAMAFNWKQTGSSGFGELRNIPLQPFKTLAADIGSMSGSEPRFKNKGGLVPAKTKVFILEMAGETLPNGTIHDGWCIVNDTGGAINGAHFDVFTGTKQLKDKIKLPNIGHVWFEGMETRIDIDYDYGLYKNA